MGPRFSAPVQTSNEVHPAFSAMSIGLFPGGKQLWRGLNQPPTSIAAVKERVEL